MIRQTPFGIIAGQREDYAVISSYLSPRNPYSITGVAYRIFNYGNPCPLPV
jgi:hypothetical protein